MNKNKHVLLRVELRNENTLPICDELHKQSLHFFCKQEFYWHMKFHILYPPILVLWQETVQTEPTHQLHTFSCIEAMLVHKLLNEIYEPQIASFCDSQSIY